MFIAVLWRYYFSCFFFVLCTCVVCVCVCVCVCQWWCVMYEIKVTIPVSLSSVTRYHSNVVLSARPSFSYLFNGKHAPSDGPVSRPFTHTHIVGSQPKPSPLQQALGRKNNCRWFCFHCALTNSPRTHIGCLCLVKAVALVLSNVTVETACTAVSLATTRSSSSEILCEILCAPLQGTALWLRFSQYEPHSLKHACSTSDGYCSVCSLSYPNDRCPNMCYDHPDCSSGDSQLTKTRDYTQHRILQSCRVWLLLPTTRGTAAKGCSDEQKTWDVRGQVVSHDSLAEFVNSTSLNDAAAAVMATISGLGSTRVIRAGFLRHFLCNFSFIKCICSVHSFIIVFFMHYVHLLCIVLVF